MVAGRSPTELRKDPVSGRWVLVMNGSRGAHGNGACPLCPGREADTPPEIAAYRTNGQPPNSPEWLVRVIPERAPLLQIEGDVQRDGHGIFDRVSGRGASEIVIEGPDHGASWDTLPSERVERVLCMYRERIVDLYRDPQIRAVMVIRHEPTPGAGPIHPISRIIGVPIIFDDIRDELAAARHHFAYKQRCLQCDILRQELGDGIRVVLETQHFLAYTPYASRRPFETWLVPVTHRHRFESSSDSELADLARMLQGTFKRLHAIQPGTPLDLVVHTAPNERVRLRDDEWRTLSEDFHWHIEIRPDRPARESAGGFAVNPVPPEVAAKELREAIGT